MEAVGHIDNVKSAWHNEKEISPSDFVGKNQMSRSN
jgi:hypothetical protein